MDENLIQQRAKQILVRLLQISEAQASSALDTKSNLHRTHPGSSPPPGTREDRPAGPPLKDFSLVDHFKWHFANAWNNPVRLLRLVIIAEVEHAERVFGSKRTKLEVVEVKDNDGNLRPETIHERRYRIAHAYPGWLPVQVEIAEGVSETFVRKARKHFGFDPITGPADMERQAA